MCVLTLIFIQLAVIAGCASSPKKLPYPAFVVVDELQNVFIAGLPGVRAKQLAGDPRTRRTSNRVNIPADWEFTSGASPTQSVELYVLAGQIMLGEFALPAGGYAFIPSGSTGMQMRSDHGAVILYFLDAANDSAVIQTPLITNSDLIEWQRGSDGSLTKELRSDPGSGARTWLLNVESNTTSGWQRSTQVLEGYLLSGAMTSSECLGEKMVTADYERGGYFYRPPGEISGGSRATTADGAVWFLRVQGETAIETVSGCVGSSD